MKTPAAPRHARHRFLAGYSLAEVLVASALVGLAIGGAVALSATMNVQNESSRTTSEALNLQDCAARLWQLGLSSTECNALLPATQDNERLARAVVPTSGSSMVWSSPSSVVLANGMGTVEKCDLTVTVRNPVGQASRTNVTQVYRPTIR